MSVFKTYWGKAVPGQDLLSARHSTLYGESPKPGSILSNCDLDGAVVFDGEIWRELDLAAMQKTVKQEQGNESEYGHASDP